MNAVVYTRFSPRPRRTIAIAGGSADSTQGQLDACRAYCAAKGYQIVGEFSDENLSGGGTDGMSAERMRFACPKLWDAFDACKSGYALIIESLDRLSREMNRHTIAMFEVAKRGARLEFVREGEAKSDPVSVFMQQVIVAAAQFQRASNALRTKDRMRSLQRNGRRVGSQPPYGYEIDPDGPASKNSADTTRPMSALLRPCESELRLVDRAVTLHRDGLSIADIVAALNTEGFRSRKGGAVYPIMIARILRARAAG